MKKYFLLGIVLVWAFYVDAQTSITKLTINVNTYTADGHVTDTVYNSHEYFYSIAPVSGRIYTECENKNVSIATGIGMLADGSLIHRSDFQKGDSIIIRTQNGSFKKADFKIILGGMSLETAIPVASYPYFYHVMNQWLSYAPQDTGSILLFGEKQAPDNVVEYATSSDKTIRIFRNFAQINLATDDTLFLKHSQKNSFIAFPFSEDKNSPIRPYKAQIGHNSVPEGYCQNSTFFAQFIAETDTLIRIEKHTISRYFHYYRNGIYEGEKDREDVLRVYENDTILFYFSNNYTLTNWGFELLYTSKSSGGSFQYPLFVDDDADSVEIEFKESDYLFISCRGFVIYTKDKDIELKSYGYDFYNDSVYTSWLLRESRSVRKFKAPKGTRATLYFKYRPTETEAVDVADTNFFGAEEMFSVIRYKNCAKKGKHFLLSDGAEENKIVDNYYAYKLLSKDGEGVDLSVPHGFCWINTTGKTFTWTRKYIDRSPGEYTANPDTIRGPGCYKFTLFTDSLANERYKQYYYLAYEVQQRSTLEFFLNGDFTVSSHNVDQIYEPGLCHKRIYTGRTDDTVIYCQIKEYPVPEVISDPIENDVVTDTIYVGDNDEVYLDSLKNYVVVYKANQSGTFKYWLSDADGGAFKGYLNYGEYKDYSWRIIKEPKDISFLVNNTQYQNLILRTSFYPVRKGDFEEYPKEAIVGVNNGNTYGNSTTKYFTFTAPQNGTYNIFSNDEETSLYTKRVELNTGKNYSFFIHLSENTESYSFYVLKENFTDTIYKDLELGGMSVTTPNEVLTTNKVGYSYTAKETGQLVFNHITDGGTILNEQMEHIADFEYPHDTFNIYKDSTYIFMPNNLLEEKWLSITFSKDNLGTSENPIPAKLGFNYQTSENGEKLGGSVLYYSYKAKDNGYLHYVGPYNRVLNVPNDEVKKGPLWSFKCDKDSVYNFLSYSFKEYLYLGYSETGKFMAPDSLMVTDSTYQVPTSANEFIGFYKAPTDGYLFVDVPGLGEENYIYAGYELSESNFYQKGEIIPIEMASVESGLTIPLTISFEEVKEGSVLLTALKPHQPECDVFNGVEFTSLSRLANINEWDFNEDGITDAYGANPVYEFTEPGDYTIRLITGNCQDLDTVYSTITVNVTCEYYSFNLGSDLTIKYSESALLSATKGAIWSDGNTGEELTIQNYTEQDSSFTVWATYQSDSCFFTDSIKITFLSDVLSITDENPGNISIYPTLIDDHLVVDAEGVQLKSISVYSNQGVCVLKQKSNSQFETIYLSNLSQGYYIVSVKTVNNVQCFKILKQ